MKRLRNVEKDGLVVTHFGGRHTLADAEAALDELLDINKGKSSIFELVINEADIQLEFSNEDEAELHKKVQNAYESFEFGALAIVAGKDIVFGLSRILENTIENERIAIAVFRTTELARAWIQEIREIHATEAINC